MTPKKEYLSKLEKELNQAAIYDHPYTLDQVYFPMVAYMEDIIPVRWNQESVREYLSLTDDISEKWVITQKDPDKVNEQSLIDFYKKEHVAEKYGQFIDKYWVNTGSNHHYHKGWFFLKGIKNGCGVTTYLKMLVLFCISGTNRDVIFQEAREIIQGSDDLLLDSLIKDGIYRVPVYIPLTPDNSDDIMTLLRREIGKYVSAADTEEIISHEKLMIVIDNDNPKKKIPRDHLRRKLEKSLRDFCDKYPDTQVVSALPVRWSEYAAVTVFPFVSKSMIHYYVLRKWCEINRRNDTGYVSEIRRFLDKNKYMLDVFESGQDVIYFLQTAEYSSSLLPSELMADYIKIRIRNRDEKEIKGILSFMSDIAQKMKSETSYETTIPTKEQYYYLTNVIPDGDRKDLHAVLYDYNLLHFKYFQSALYGTRMVITYSSTFINDTLRKYFVARGLCKDRNISEMADRIIRLNSPQYNLIVFFMISIMFEVSNKKANECIRQVLANEMKLSAFEIVSTINVDIDDDILRRVVEEWELDIDELWGRTLWNLCCSRNKYKVAALICEKLNSEFGHKARVIMKNFDNLISNHYDEDYKKETKCLLTLIADGVKDDGLKKHYLMRAEQL